MSIMKEFREFAVNGNVIDLAVGVNIGVAFGSIMDSLVKDIITPIIGLMGGQPDLSTTSRSVRMRRDGYSRCFRR